MSIRTALQASAISLACATALGCASSNAPDVLWRTELDAPRVSGDLMWTDLTGDGTPTLLVPARYTGQLHALNGDGTVRWIYQTPHGHQFATGPAIVQPDPESPRRRVVIVDRTEWAYGIEPDGTVAWSKRVRTGHVRGGVSVAGAEAGEQQILFGGDARHLYSATPDGDIRWMLSNRGDMKGSVESGDVDGDGRTEIFAAAGRPMGSDHAAGEMLCLNDSGRVLWSFPTPRAMRGDPTLADLDGNGEYEVVFADWSGNVFALDARSGQQRWHSEVGNDVRRCFAVADLTGDERPEIIVGHRNGVTCFGPDGAAIWDFVREEAPELNVEVPPAVADVTGDGRPNVVVAGKNGVLYCLDADGALAWEYSGGLMDIDSAPLVADVNGDGKREIVFSDAMGRVTCLATPADADAPAPWPMGRRRVEKSPGYAPQATTLAKLSIPKVGVPVAGTTDEDAIVLLPTAERDTPEGAIDLHWDIGIRMRYDSWDALSPMPLYVESPRPNPPARGTVHLTFLAGNREVGRHDVPVRPVTGSTIIEAHLGALAAYDGDVTSVLAKFVPAGDGPESSALLTTRRLRAEPLRELAARIRRRLERLDYVQRTVHEDATRDLAYASLEFGEADIDEGRLGWAFEILTELDAGLSETGYAWAAPEADPDTSLSIDTDGVIRRDGEPVFLLGEYCVNGAKEVNELADLGFNLSFHGGDDEFRQACAERNFNFMGGGIGDNLPTWSRIVRLRRRMEQVAAEPGLIAYYITDEPSHRGTPPEMYRRTARLMKIIDPHHLTYLTASQPYLGVPHIDVPELAGPFIYPIHKNWSITMVATQADHMRAAMRDEQAMLFILQDYTTAGSPFPTPDEGRVMAYLAVIHGARGLAWFCYQTEPLTPEELESRQYVMSPQGSPELWAQTQRTARDFGEIGPHLMGRRTPPHVWQQGRRRVDWTVVEKDGVVMVLAANPSPVPVTHAFDVGDVAGEVEVLWEDRALQARGGTFSDSFEPMAVHVYRMER